MLILFTFYILPLCWIIFRAFLHSLRLESAIDPCFDVSMDLVPGAYSYAAIINDLVLLFGPVTSRITMVPTSAIYQ